jgi:hypothetical protein
MTFAEELPELADEILLAERLIEQNEARRKAAKLSADQWHLLTQASRSPDGTIQVTLPALVAPARALTALGLGEYFPPPKIGTKATFSISRKGRKLRGEGN